MMSGSSSIFNAVTPMYRVEATFWIQKMNQQVNES